MEIIDLYSMCEKLTDKYNIEIIEIDIYIQEQNRFCSGPNRKSSQRKALSVEILSFYKQENRENSFRVYKSTADKNFSWQLILSEYEQRCVLLKK